MGQISRAPARWRGRATTLLLATTMLTASPAWAATTNWTNGTGDWFTSGNWSAGVPGASDTANVANGGTAQIGQTATLDTLNVSSGSSIEILSGGGLAATSTTLGASGTLIFDSATTTVAGALSGDGAVTVRNGSDVIFTGNDSYAGSTTIIAGAALRIGTGGTTGAINSDVADDGTLEFNRSDYTTYGGAINGNGTLIKDGSGTLILTNTNIVQNTTTIVAGTIQFGNGGTTGALFSAAGMTNNGVLAFDRSNDLSFYNNVSGSGRLEQNGSGILYLGGMGTFTGGTYINSGIVNWGSDGAFGAASSPIVFNGGTLQMSLSVAPTTDHPIILNAGGGTIDTESVGLFLDENITGAGGLTKTGGAALILTGDSTYTGNTVVTGGDQFIKSTLELGYGGTTGSVIGNLVLDSTTTEVIFNRSNDVNFTGNISGAGSVTQTGTGTLTLSGTNTYTGTTTVNAGTLIINGNNDIGHGELFIGEGTARFTSDMVFTHDVGFGLSLGDGGIDTQGFTITVTGNLLGGELIKNGSGTLILAGDASSDPSYFPVSATINQGTLQLGNGGATGIINGSVSNNGALVFNLSGTQTFGGGITGSGSVTKLGSGTVILTGLGFAQPGYTGVTTIAAGTLQIGNGGYTNVFAGDAVDNGVLAFNIANQYTFYSGSISGTGSLVQDGPGDLYFSGNSTYTGETDILAGALYVGDNFSNASIASTSRVVDNGTLGFDNGAPVTFSAPIGGTGGLFKEGPGTLILTGKNTYSGGTFIAYGAIQLGDATHTTQIAGDIVVYGFLDVENADLSMVTTIENNTGAIFDNASSAAHAVITNASSLSFNDNSTAASATITNAAQYAQISFSGNATAGSAVITSTDVSTGLFFSGDSTAGNASVTLDQQGEIDFNDRSTAGTASITVEGGSKIYFTNTSTGGSAAINVTGGSRALFDNDSDGGNAAFTIDATSFLDFSSSAGMNNDRKVSAGSIAGGGAIYLGADELSVGGDNASTDFAGAINDHSFDGNSGTGGSLVKVGAGTLTLDGVNTYTGPTTIEDGILDVNGSIANSAVTLAGGQLKGHGTVGGIAVGAGAIVAPGNSIGTLHIAGNVTFNTSAIYQVEVDAGGHSDLIDATGTAQLNGGVVQVLAARGTYSPNTTYDILNAPGGVTGTFSSVSVDQNFLAARLVYNTDEVDLVLRLVDIDFGPYTHSPNEASVAAAVKAGGFDSTLYSVFLAHYTSTGAFAGALDQLSGDVHASIRSVALEDSRDVRQSIIDRLRGAVSGDASGTLGGGADDARGFGDGAAMWVRVFSNWGTNGSDGNASPFGRSLSGIMAGIDTDLGGSFRVGLSGGYTHDDIATDGHLSHATAGNGHVGGYGGWNGGALALRLGADYAFGNATVRRDIDFLEFTDQTRNKESLRTTQVFGEAGYALGTGPVGVEPFADVAWVQASTGAFTEFGGAAALAGDDRSASATYTDLGLRLATAPIGSPDCALSPRIALAWQHAFGGVRSSQTETFIETQETFTTLGAPLDRDAAVADVGFDVAIMTAAKLGLGYSGVLGGKIKDHTVHADFSWQF